MTTDSSSNTARWMAICALALLAALATLGAAEATGSLEELSGAVGAAAEQLVWYNGAGGRPCRRGGAACAELKGRLDRLAALMNDAYDSFMPARSFLGGLVPTRR